MTCVMLVKIKNSDNRNKNNRKMGIYYCVCGNFKEIDNSSVKSGNTKSCGCLKQQIVKNRNTRHGLSHTEEYDTWLRIKNRCYNTNNAKYYTYGARGIRVCNRWLGEDGFKNFLEDMGKKPSSDLSIHRIDNDGDYCPENCKWASKKEQSLEKTTSRKITIRDKTQTLCEWAEECGLNYSTILFRIDKMNMTPEEALTAPLKKNFRNYHTIDGVTKCVKDWAKQYNIAYQTVLNRLRKGADIIEALTKPINEVMSKTSYEGKRNKW